MNCAQSLVAGTAGGLLATGKSLFFFAFLHKFVTDCLLLSVLVVAALYPVELIKTRMQVIDHQQQYRSFVQALRSIIQKEGPLSLYHGFTPAMVAASGSWGGYFYFYERSKRRKLSAQLHDTLASSEPEKYSKLGPFDHVSCLCSVFYVKWFLTCCCCRC